MRHRSILVAGLWVGVTAKGERILAGRLNSFSKFVIVKNKRKQKNTDPDFWLQLFPLSEGDQKMAAIYRETYKELPHGEAKQC